MLRFVINTIIFATLFLNASVQASSCSQWGDCKTCTSNSIWTGTCRWCPRSESCHDPGSLLNPCHSVENYVNSDMCYCTHPIPDSSADQSDCSWYTTGHGASPPANTTLWGGEDFLPYSYLSAATCACTGNGNPLWNTPIAKCVRAQILKGHIELPVDLKEAVRESTIKAESPTVPIVPALYDIHVNAYAYCGCPGKPAPLIFWEDVYRFAGAVMLCGTSLEPTSEIFWILAASACGCGW